MNTVVVTGLGTVNPLGSCVERFSEALLNGRSGEGRITRFPVDDFPVKLAYETRPFEAKSKSSALDPFVRYALAAAGEAVRDSGLDWDRLDRFRIGCSVSSSKGGVTTIEKYRERFNRSPSAMLSAICYASIPPNIAAQWIAKKFQISGPTLCYVAACATGLTAMIEGARMVAEGRVDVCLAGAADASITPLMLAGYRSMGALSRDVLRPFDRRRSGFAIGEGAGVVVLEERNAARRRGARIYGEILGWAYGTDVYKVTHFDPHGRTLSRTLAQLLSLTGLRPMDVDYCHVHGTGTPAGDRYEAEELGSVFGARSEVTAFSAIKSRTGHMLGASGACEFISVLLSLRDQYVPGVAHCEMPDKACRLNLVRGAALHKPVRVALLHNMGFGGRLAAVALRKPEA